MKGSGFFFLAPCSWTGISDASAGSSNQDYIILFIKAFTNQHMGKSLQKGTWPFLYVLIFKGMVKFSTKQFLCTKNAIMEFHTANAIMEFHTANAIMEFHTANAIMVFHTAN